MKRSEMVKYLHKLLNTFEDCKLDETSADEILEGLEHMGMNPPEIEIKVNAPAKTWYYKGNEWEKE